MPRFTPDTAPSKVQPGRVMIVLKDAFVPDDVIRDIVIQQGEVTAMHRPESNQQLCFVQYADPETATYAISKLRNYPIFRAVDPALKSERYQENNPNDQNQNQNQKKQQKQQFNQNRNNNNFRRNDGGGFNGRSQDMDSPPKQQQQSSSMEPQPDIPLGCWYCTKMPNFECRCGAFYCDIGCQRADWAKHKDICMPRLVPISYSNKLILQEAVASKNSSSISSTPYYPSSPEYGGNQNQQQQQQQPRQQQQRQQQQQQQQNRFNGNDYNQNQRNNSQQQQQQQQGNVQNRLANGPRKNLQNGQEGSANVNEASNKLQRLKLAKTASASPSSPGRRQILEPGRFPPEGVRVKITTSLQSGTLYIYHSNSQHGGQSDFQTLINRLHQAADNESRPLEEAPEVEDVVFAPYQGMFYRAKVLAVKEGKIEVQFPDFGNLDTVVWKECREILNEELKWARYLSFPVTLEGVEGPLTTEQKQLVESLEFEEEFELVKAESVGDSEVREVVLKRERQNVTLNMTLVELKEKEQRQRRQREEQRLEKERLEKAEQEKKELASKIADPASYKPVMFDECITTKQLTPDQRYNLAIIDASDVLETKVISVIAAEDAPQYAAVIQDCERFGLADPNKYRPTEIGEVCLGRHENDWTRVLFDGEGEQALLLDVGALQIPDEFRRFPTGMSRVVYNNEVVVENFPLLETMMKDGKPESLNGTTIDAWVAPTDDGTLGIRIIPKSG